MPGKIKIPDEPSDGQVITYWKIDSLNEGLEHCRLTYYRYASAKQVLGAGYLEGVPKFVDEWYTESRYVPNSRGDVASEWSGGGRADTTFLQGWFAGKETVATFIRFEDARDALVERMRSKAAQLRKQADRLDRLVERFTAMSEPA